MPRLQHPACPTQLSEVHKEQFARDGFLAFVDVLSPTEVTQARAAMTELIERIARDATTKQKGPFWIADGKKFGVQFENGFSPENANRDDVAQTELQVRKLMWFVDEHAHLDYLAREHPKVLGVLEGLIGREPILYQDMALIKPPFIGSEKPWHQDNAYFSVTPLAAICGVWIALDDATVDNGCMHALRGGHKLGALRHHHDRDCEILPDRLAVEQPVVPIELPAGGAMFFSGMLPHQTPPNASPDRRRALQYHYRSANSTVMESEKYFEIFAERDGTPASCAAAARRGL